MWTVQRNKLTDERGTQFNIRLHAEPATVEDVLCGWEQDADFRSLFNSLLAESPYRAFRWETPAVTAASVSQPFQFVLLDSPGLARRPEPEAFAEHFRQGKDGVVVFANLGGDAILVVPCQVGEASAYGHLGAFVRNAPEAQRHALWQSVATAMRQRLGSKPVWLSTAGGGVSWLHVRLDDRPKYYGFAPYKAMKVG
jgi:hypothetical protein